MKNVAHLNGEHVSSGSLVRRNRIDSSVETRTAMSRYPFLILIIHWEKQIPENSNDTRVKHVHGTADVEAKEKS